MERHDMEPVREPAWAEHEKVYLLAEILKAAPIPSQVLYNLIREHHIQPRWNDMALPHGRSIRSCQTVYREIDATQSTTDHRRPPAPLPPPNMFTAAELPQKRPHQPETAMATPIGRLLQPRPPHSYTGEFVGGGPAYATAMSPVGEPANKKKRGRPTKAEAQQRAQEAAARGEVYPPPRKARTSITMVDHPPQPPQPGGQGDIRPLAQTPPNAPTPSYSGAMTPQQTRPDQAMELSSSGKKKRSKPTPLELEKHPRAHSATDSPLAYGSTTGDTHRSHTYSSFTPISAPLPSESRDRDVRMEGVEESQPRTTTPHSFKDTVGI